MKSDGRKRPRAEYLARLSSFDGTKLGAEVELELHHCNVRSCIYDKEACIVRAMVDLRNLDSRLIKV